MASKKENQHTVQLVFNKIIVFVDHNKALNIESNNKNIFRMK